MDTKLPELGGKNQEQRRDLSSKGDAKRRMFDKFAYILERYAIDTPEELTSESIKGLLEGNLSELQNLDAFIRFRYLSGFKPEINPENTEVGFVAYKLVFPSIKDLNDKYIGPSLTDEFIAKIHTLIKQTFDESEAESLTTHFKGGSFVINLGKSKLENGKRLAFLSRNLKSVQIAAKNALVVCLDAQDQRLSLDSEAIARKLAVDFSFDLLNRQADINENRAEIAELRERLMESDDSVQIAFGLDKLESTKPLEIASAIVNSERAANIAAVRKFEANQGGSKERAIIHQFDYGYQFADLIFAQRDIAREARIEDESGNFCIRVEWKDFFEVDEEGYVFMKPEMLNRFRKKNFEGYGDDPDFDEKIRRFEIYYRNINTVDVLKKFRTENFDNYLERSDRILALIQEIEESIEDDERSDSKLRDLFSRSNDELEIELKDECEGITGNIRSMIKKLVTDTEEDDKDGVIILNCDHIGFGVKNIRLMEEWIKEVLEKRFKNGNGTKREKIELVRGRVERFVEEMGEDFYLEQLAAEDGGSEHLRKVDRDIVEATGATLNCSGGDEIAAIIDLPTELEDREKLNQRIDELARRSELRIAKFIDNLRFHRAPVNRIVEKNRERIVRLIDILQTSEGVWSAIKKNNDQQRITELDVRDRPINFMI